MRNSSLIALLQAEIGHGGGWDAAIEKAITVIHQHVAATDSTGTTSAQPELTGDGHGRMAEGGSMGDALKEDATDAVGRSSPASPSEIPDNETRHEIFCKWVDDMEKSDIPGRRIVASTIRKDFMLVSYLDELIGLGPQPPARELVVRDKCADGCVIRRAVESFTHDNEGGL